MGREDEAPPALDHVQVAAPAGCEARARWFYGELLGLDEVEKPSPLAGRGGVWFALASGAQLHVGVADGFVAAVKAHPGLRLPDARALEALAARLGRRGLWRDVGPRAAGGAALFHRRPVRQPRGVAGARAVERLGFRRWEDGHRRTQSGSCGRFCSYLLHYRPRPPRRTARASPSFESQAVRSGPRQSYAAAPTCSPLPRTFGPWYGPGFGRERPPGRARRRIVRCTMPSCWWNGPVL